MDKELLAAIRSVLQEELEPLKNQQQEDHEIIKALMHASEVHKAGIDNLTYAMARVEGRLTEVEGRLTGIESDVKELHDGQERIEIVLDHVEGKVKVISEMYGDHEAQIRELRRKVASS